MINICKFSSDNTTVTYTPWFIEKYTILDVKVDDNGELKDVTSVLIDRNTFVEDDGWDSTNKKFTYTKDEDSTNILIVDLSSYLTNIKYYENFT